MDKWAQIDARVASGFAVMPTQLVENEADVARFPIRPAILKPRAALDICGAAIDKGRTFIIEEKTFPKKRERRFPGDHISFKNTKWASGEGFFGIAQSGRIYAGFGHREVENGKSGRLGRERLRLARTRRRRISSSGDTGEASRVARTVHGRIVARLFGPGMVHGI